jgi:hypothetical protein
MRDDGVHRTLGRDVRMLPEVPLLEAPAPASVSLMDLAASHLLSLLDDGRRHYGRRVLAVGDALTRRWLERTRNPYRPEIDEVCRRLGQPGAVMLNMSYEWSCTAGVGTDPTGRGCRLLRTLDWPMPGLGRYVVVSRQAGPAGQYYAATWPGYVGVLTAMAPGRFSAAINQPPLRRHTGICAVDWIIGRVGLWRSLSLPPSHLLRRVFDTCATYEEARRVLIQTPLCLPSFFTLAGLEPAAGCVIERLESAAVVHDAPCCISNHWVGFELRGHDRGNDSTGRLASARQLLPQARDDFDWVVPPVLNRTTRLAVAANAARGFFAVQGWEREEPVTARFALELPPPGAVSGVPPSSPPE